MLHETVGDIMDDIDDAEKEVFVDELIVIEWKEHSAIVTYDKFVAVRSMK